MPRPSMGRSARVVPVTVKISEDEAETLRRTHGSPSKGIRAVLDRQMAPIPTSQPGERPSGRCRIHPEWEVVTSVTQGGMETIGKRCTTCGFTTTTTKPA